MSNRDIDAGDVEVILGDNVAKSVTVEAGEETVLDVDAPYYSGGGSVPVISVDAKSLPPGSDATATITGNPATPLITFGIPRGDKGDKGENGADGVPGKDGVDGVTPNVSATATVDGSVGTPSVSVRRSGTNEAPVLEFAFSNLKGEKGDQGAPGKDGANGQDGAPGADGATGADGITPSIKETLTAWSLLWREIDESNCRIGYDSCRKGSCFSHAYKESNHRFCSWSCDFGNQRTSRRT